MQIEGGYFLCKKKETYRVEQVKIWGVRLLSPIRGTATDTAENLGRIMSWKLPLRSHTSEHDDMKDVTMGTSVHVSKEKPLSPLGGEGCSDRLVCREPCRPLA